MVFGIVALLVGLLLPALAGARESARAAACSNNLRQMGIATQAYVTDNKFHYPLVGELVPGETIDLGWDNAIYPFIAGGQQGSRPDRRFQEEEQLES